MSVFDVNIDGKNNFAFDFFWWGVSGGPIDNNDSRPGAARVVVGFHRVDSRIL